MDQNNMDLTTARDLQKVGEKFHLPGPFFSYEELCNGNVNHTYKVNYVRDDGTGMAVIKPYLMQKVNTYAFRDPIALMNNIDAVTEYIHAVRPKQTCLHYHHVGEGDNRLNYFMEGDSFWRVCNYVPSVTFDNCDDIDVVYNAGEAFGDFQMILADFDVSQLAYTIPDFHNTRKRYETLLKDTRRDEKGRVKEVEAELEYLVRVQDKACMLTDMLNRGELPLRVTHNDTKINNVLFDEKTHKPLVVIDLDTVMPGLVGHDFGDAIRFAANFTEEDAKDVSQTGVNLNIFWAFAEGFLAKTAQTLTEAEIDTLGLSCFVLACELATRFLDDYLNGDKYFHTHYEGHNLVRTRCQIALAKDMERKMDAMNGIVKACAAKYR